MRISLCGFIICLVLFMLSACVSQGYQPNVYQMEKDVPFSVEGRLAVKVDKKGNYANFSWQHTKDNDEIEISTPIGNTIAKIIRNETDIRLIADGKETFSNNAENLTKKMLGYPLPLDNLVWWVQGKIAPDVKYFFDNSSVLHQDGWQISFFREKKSDKSPSRIDLVRDNLSIKIVSHAWQLSE